MKTPEQAALEISAMRRNDERPHKLSDYAGSHRVICNRPISVNESDKRYLRQGALGAPTIPLTTWFILAALVAGAVLGFAL